MTLVREYQPTFVLGDGETKEFSYLFEEVSENFIKVIVKHSDDSTYMPVFSVDSDAHKVVFGESETAPLDTDLICIYRETPDLQDTPFRTLQGYDAKALENILSKIVAMIQELKANGFSTQILQGTPWQLDLLHPADDGASVVVDYNARILKKGLYFQIVSENLQVSADGVNFIKMPKSADITEFRQLETVLEDLTVQYRLQYKVNGVWYNAESNAEATADEALQVAQDAKDIAQAASDKVDAFDDRLIQAEQDSSDAKQDASDAKDIAQTASDAVSGHITDTNNPHSVTKAQIGLSNCDNTADLDKPISTATQTALDTKATPADITSTISTHNADSSAHSSIISPIQEVIPTAATSSNQLADKNFVNSSIATSTATFCGTYNSLAELEAQTADENDYGFVMSTDAAGNTIYNRYKYTTATTPASWVFEYALNNSSFTAIQWDAINSGANPTNIGQIATNTSAISSHTGNTSNPHQVTKTQVGLGNVDNTSDLNKPISTATQTALNGKQATISDLATIRSNAQAGKAASDTIATYSDIVTHDVAEFATAAQGAKADTAVQPGDLATVATSGDYDDLINKPSIPAAQVNSDWNANSGVAQILNKPTIPTVGNGTITITQGGTTKGTFTTNQSGNTTIALDAGGGGGADIDNSTITTNAQSKIQAVAVIDQNSGIAKTWTGTMAQYDAITTKDPKTEYIITDDIGGSATEIGAITEDINDLKEHTVIGFQAPTSANNYTWYRKYSDGWVEQGGGRGASNTTINLPVAMSNSSYTAVGTVNNASGITQAMSIPIIEKTTTTIRIVSFQTGGYTVNWQVSGMAA